MIYKPKYHFDNCEGFKPRPKTKYGLTQIVNFITDQWNYDLNVMILRFIQHIMRENITAVTKNVNTIKTS